MFIDDLTGTLSGADKTKILDTQVGFDVKVVVASTSARGDLDAQVAKMVTSANTLAIGVDPVHRYTFTHFGVGTGIPRERYQDVSRSGNGEFKQGHWADGIRAIVSSASAARTATSATTTIVMPTQQTTVEHPFPVLPFIFGAVALAFGFFLLWRWSRRKASALETSMEDFRGEAAQMRSRNIEEQGWHDRMKANAAKYEPPAAASTAKANAAQPRVAPESYAAAPPSSAPYRAPAPVHVHHHHAAPAPVIVDRGGGNDLLTGVLLGEAIAARPPERVIERHYSPPPRARTPEPSFSSSSSSSSWGSDSSSSFDSGSGGGDFSGGFDGGGGGGDF